MVLSQAVEDYLKTIYVLEAEGKEVTTSSIAELMDVSSASTTNMIKRLSKLGLVDYQSYKGASLTNAGRKIALEIIRHHRLLELYLMEVMGYSWDEVHDEAEKLEHHISEQFEDKIAELLNNPTHDPHGDPIPSKDGIMPPMEADPLNQVEIGRVFIVSRVKDQDPDLLRYFEQIGILPGVKITVKEKAPFNGPITILIEDTEMALGYEVTNKIFVAAFPGQ